MSDMNTLYPDRKRGQRLLDSVLARVVAVALVIPVWLLRRQDRKEAKR